jgi:hypothetical protein
MVSAFGISRTGAFPDWVSGNRWTSVATPGLKVRPGLKSHPGGVGLDLNGSTHSVIAPTTYTTTNGSILLYAYFPTTPPTGKTLASQSDNAYYGLGLGVSTTNFQLWVGGNPGQHIEAGTVSTGARVILGTWGSAGLELYLDGSLAGSDPAKTLSPTTSGGFNFEIGAFNYSGGRVLFATETVLAFAIWSRRLPPTEARLYSAQPWQIFRPLPRRIWLNAPTGEAPSAPKLRVMQSALQW